MRVGTSIACRAAAVAAALGLSSAPLSATIFDDRCGQEGARCTFTVSIDGQEVGKGNYSIDPESGSVELEQGAYFLLDDGTYAGVDYVYGEGGRALGFAVSAGAPAAMTFSFSFSLPIALAGPIAANSSVSYSLTSVTDAGAQIVPRPGSHVLTAEEVDTDLGGHATLHKAVDVGEAFAVIGRQGTDISPGYVASSTFIGSLAYDTMMIRADFSLTQDSQVAVFGFVEQVPVPEPSTFALLMLGLAIAGFALRRTSFTKPRNRFAATGTSAA